MVDFGMYPCALVSYPFFWEALLPHRHHFESDRWDLWSRVACLLITLSFLF